MFEQIKKLCRSRLGKKRDLIKFPGLVSAMRAARRGKQAAVALTLLESAGGEGIPVNKQQHAILANLAAATVLDAAPGAGHAEALQLLGKIEQWTNVTYTTALQCHAAALSSDR